VEILNLVKVHKEEIAASIKDLKFQNLKDIEKASINNLGISKITFSLLIKCSKQ
jgi:hypothetical protein